MKYPTYLKNHVKDIKDKYLSTMTVCADDGNENIELYYFGQLIDVKGEKSKYISDSNDKPLLIVGRYKGEDFVIHDNSKHGYDNMFCDMYSLEQTNDRELVKFDVPTKRFILEIGYSIDYDDEKEDFDYDEKGDMILIDGRTMSFEDVKMNGFDYISLSYEAQNGEVIQFVDIELA